MASGIPDLWSQEVATKEMVTPAAILRQQASLLGPKTKNLVEAEVSTMSSPPQIMLNFNLVVPALQGYKYRLFQLVHGAELYPVRVTDGPKSGIVVTSEQELIKYLGEVLSSERTVSLVAALRAQSQG